MKKNWLIVMMIFIVSAAITCSYEDDPSEPEDEPDPINTEALEYVKAMGFGVNLGNTFDSLNTGNIAGETGWGNPRVSLDFIKSLKTHGFKSVRVPVSWVDYMGEAPDYLIEETWMARIEEVVDWILEEDLFCILNLHHDGGGEINSSGYIHPKYWIKQISIPEKEEEVTNRFIKVWEQIATRFEDKSDKLVLEAMNEIGFDNIWNRYSGGQVEEKKEAYRLVNKLNQVFVDTVRSTGGKNTDRFLLFCGYWTDIAATLDPLFLVPQDSAEARLILSVHFYDPYQFTMEMQTTWGAPWHYNSLNNRIKSLEGPFIKKGIPIILGEYAVNIRNQGRGSGTLKEPESRQLWMFEVTQLCIDLGISPILWETGMRNNNNGMADVQRSSPFNISENLKYVFDNLVYPDE